MVLIKYKPVFVSGIFICLFVLGLFYYWFVLADRYFIFLYNHLGATPFDERTISRYWMSGLVTSGATFVFYTITHWFVGRLAGVFYRDYNPPVWWQVWLFCVIPLSVGILYITMTFNNPTLPLSVAILCAVTTLFGLALALYTSSLAVTAPIEFVWLVVIAAGLTPIFLLLRAIELPRTGLTTTPFAYTVAIGGTLIGAMWSVIMIRLQSRLYPRSHKGVAIKLYAVGLCISYLLLPLFHYIVLTPTEFRYISVSANFFALNRSVQLMTLVVGMIAVIGLEKVQRHWSE